MHDEVHFWQNSLLMKCVLTALFGYTESTFSIGGAFIQIQKIQKAIVYIRLSVFIMTVSSILLYFMQWYIYFFPTGLG